MHVNVPSNVDRAIEQLSININPIEFSRLLGIEPFDWQRELLLSEDPRCLCNCSRQSGKSEVASIMALHTALTKPGSLIVMVAPSLRQSSLLFRRTYDHWRDLGKPYGAEIETALSLVLGNHSKIYAVPSGRDGSNIRGFSNVSMLVIDEMSRCTDALITAVRPFLARSMGRLIGISTPNGRRGQFYELFEKGGDAYRRWLVTAYDVGIDPTFLETERSALGESFFSAEYLCSFNALETAVFDWDDVEAASTDVTEEFHALDYKMKFTAKPV